MKIPLSQVLEDEDVKRAICLVVEAELEQANRTITEKTERLQSAEAENLFLKGRIIQLERENMEKEMKLRKLQGEQQQVAKKKYEQLNLQQPEQQWSSDTDLQTEDDTGEKAEEVQHEQDAWKCGWVCVCEAKFSTRKSLEQHLKYHRTGQPFSCSRCSTRFVHATDLRKHLRGVHKVEPEPWMNYGCRQCGGFFQTISELKQHQKTAHLKSKVTVVRVKQELETEVLHGLAKVTKTKTPSSSGKSCPNRKPLSGQRFLCHCGKIFVAMRELKRHVKEKIMSSPTDSDYA